MSDPSKCLIPPYCQELDQHQALLWCHAIHAGFLDPLENLSLTLLCVTFCSSISIRMMTGGRVSLLRADCSIRLPYCCFHTFSLWVAVVFAINFGSAVVLICVRIVEIKLLAFITPFELPFNTVCQTSLLILAYEKSVFGYLTSSCLSSLWRFYTVYVKLLLLFLIVVNRVSIISETEEYQSIAVSLDTW